MGNILARIKIIVRIYLLIAIAALGIAGVVIVSSNEIDTALTSIKQEETRFLVETAYSLVANLEERAKNRRVLSRGSSKESHRCDFRSAL